jgi:hypothetical protein
MTVPELAGPQDTARSSAETSLASITLPLLLVPTVLLHPEVGCFGCGRRCKQGTDWREPNEYR